MVKIGFIGPLTGPNAAQGVGARNAFDLKIREANASGKFPYKIEMVALDVLIGMHPHQDSTGSMGYSEGDTWKGSFRNGVEKGSGTAEPLQPGTGRELLQTGADLPQADRRKVEICRALASDPKLLLLGRAFCGDVAR